MKITKDVMLLASALGGGGGGQQELDWPFIVHYDKLLSIDNGTLNQHKDVTGGLRAYITTTTSVVAKSVLNNTGWSSCTDTMSECGMLETVARIDLTNIAQILLHYGGEKKSSFGLQYRPTTSDDWSSLDSELIRTQDDTLSMDTSGLTGFLYVRFYNNNQYDPIPCIIDEISTVPGPYLYRTGDPVLSLTGGWFSSPAAPTPSQLLITQYVDRIRAYQTADMADTRIYMNVLATKDLVDLANIVAIHCTVTNTVLYMVPGIRLYDESWNLIASVRGSNQFIEYPVPTDVSIDVSSYTDKYHIGLCVFSYTARNHDKYMDLYNVRLEKAAS